MSAAPSTVLALVGAVAAVLFVVVLAVDGATRPGYRPVRHPVSALALGPRGWVQTTSFVGCGAGVALGGLGLALGPSVLLGLAAVLLGVGLVASGVWPMDPMRGYPPGTAEGDPDVLSRSHVRHDQAGAVVFLLLPALPAIGALSAPLPTAARVASGLLAVLVGVGVARFTRAWEADAPRAGLEQRVPIVLALLWLAAASAYLVLR